MKPKCKYGNHRWDNGSKPGSHCLDCQKEYGIRIPKKKRAEAAPPPSPAAKAAPATAPARPVNEGLRAKWGMGPAPQPEQTAQAAQAPAAAQPEPEKESDDKVDVGELVREEIPDLVIMAEQKTIRMFGRQPNDPDSKLKAKFDESLEKVCRGKTPKIAVSPGVALVGLAAALWLQMFIGADKLPPARGKASANATPDSTKSPPSSLPTPPLSLVPSPGTAEDAGANVSDE